MKRRIAFLLVVYIFAIGAAADEELFESVRHDPLLLRRFLEQMPKGGDLHNHLSGTVYGETYIPSAPRTDSASTPGSSRTRRAARTARPRCLHRTR
jgi:hypothetical protein